MCLVQVYTGSERGYRSTKLSFFEGISSFNKTVLDMPYDAVRAVHHVSSILVLNIQMWSLQSVEQSILVAVARRERLSKREWMKALKRYSLSSRMCLCLSIFLWAKLHSCGIVFILLHLIISLHCDFRKHDVIAGICAFNKGKTLVSKSTFQLRQLNMKAARTAQQQYIFSLVLSYLLGVFLILVFYTWITTFVSAFQKESYAAPVGRWH